jgi:hypothetical protein
MFWMNGRFRRLSWVLALSSLGLVGCANSVRRGATLYSDGRYIEAAEVFERNEYHLGEMSPREQADYGLYRGVTMQMLGDLANAQRWMSYSYDVERANPGSLTAERRQLLDGAWSALRQPNSAPSQPLPGTAIAATQAPAIRPQAVGPGTSEPKKGFVSE